MQLNIVTYASPTPCKICDAASPVLGTVDFHKSCLEQTGSRLNQSGIPVTYRRCTECGFVFTHAFDDWSSEDFKNHIYNADYHLVDPEYTGERATRCADTLNRLLQARKPDIRLVDYGGGNGELVKLLREQGYNAQVYDPYSGHHTRPAGLANVVTCFEVIEHAHNPKETLNDLVTFLSPEGVVIFSTLLQPGEFDKIGLNWWYIAPRNGHISIHSTVSIARLFAAKGFNLHPVTEGIYMACRN